MKVAFTVQTGCVTASPPSLTFNGVAGISDPPAQKLTVTNCGAISTWSASLQLQTTQQWLSLSTNTGTLNAKGSQGVSVSASDLSTKLPGGSYSGKILLVSGSSLFTVAVQFIVKGAPTLTLVSPNPPSFFANQQCSFNNQNSSWTCIASIEGSPNNTGPVTWSGASQGVPGITFTPNGGSLNPGQGTRVIIRVPKNNCAIPTTLTFKAPGNTISISWSCRLG